MPLWDIKFDPQTYTLVKWPVAKLALCFVLPGQSLRRLFFFFSHLVSAGSYLHNKPQHLALTAFLAAFPQSFLGWELLWLGSPEHMWKVRLTTQNFSSRWAGLLWRTGESARWKWNKYVLSPHTSPISFGAWMEMFSRFKMIITCQS